MALYERMRVVPKEAQKTIGAGRLKGMTDINPMWRIQKLTEEFGECGVGWWTKDVTFWLEPAANGEVIAFCSLWLHTKGREPSFGIGGSKMVAKETSGLYSDDECYKKAYTDAISVACKAFGMGADVYWAQGTTKYDAAPASSQPKPNFSNDNAYKMALQVKLREGEHAGKTLEEVYKTDRKSVKGIYETADDDVKTAIRVIEAKIKEKK
ncbi:MAG: hypothetical protein IKU30_01045 [Clostridia bacterium]|nr:hypothetical protein [Clostridia bacterium]